MGEDDRDRTKEKRKFFDEGMEFDHVLVQLDSRAEGVDVPAHLSQDPALTLKLSHLFQGDTTHDEEAITSYLRFSGNYYCCYLPWTAIWGMTCSKGENKVWAEDLPREVMVRVAREKISELGRRFIGKKKSTPEASEREEDLSQGAKASNKPRPQLKPVPPVEPQPNRSKLEETGELEASAEKDNAGESPKKKGGHLKRIK
jgi:stringent starvation protein B